jgi:hypothetical protein
MAATFMFGSRFLPKDPNIFDRLSEYTKLGLPVYREIREWKKQDKSGFDKFMGQLGIAYVYQRRAKTPAQVDNAFLEFFKAMDVWRDWKTGKEKPPKKKKKPDIFKQPGIFRTKQKVSLFK